MLPNVACAGLFFAPQRVFLTQVALRFGIDQHVFVAVGEELGIIFSPFLPRQVGDEVLLPKHFITQQLQLRLLVVVNADKDDAVVAQQVFGQQQARVHERQPPAVGACAVDVFDVVDVVPRVAQLLQHLRLLGRKVVAVDEGVALGVVGWVYIDQLDLAKVALTQ